jgi:hypothetical protein
VRDTLGRLAKKRGKLAHGRVIVFPAAPPGQQFAIVPMFARPGARKRRQGLPPTDSLCVRDVDLIRALFGRATSQLRSLRARIRGEEDLFAEPAQREPQPQTLVQLRRQIREDIPPRD